MGSEGTIVERLQASMVQATAIEPTGEAILQARDVGFAGTDGCRYRGLDVDVHKHQAAWVRGGHRIARNRLVRILCGIESPIDGEIRWKGLRIARAARVMHAELAFLDSGSGLSEMLTPLENLEMHLRVRGCCARIDSESALARVGLAAVMHLPVGRLKAAERRRVAIARMLVTRATMWAIEEQPQPLEQAELDLLGELVDQHLQGRGLLLFAGQQTLVSAPGELVVVDLEEAKRWTFET